MSCVKACLVIFFCVFHFILILCEKPKERPLVKTPLGDIKGYHKKSAKRTWFSAFEGIPYAKPPIGELRFEPPVPIEPWSGTWDAITVTECPQTGLLQSTALQGDEDCLYLNVYVPRETPNPNEKLDVIVHIHGGFFTYGSGHSYSHPEYFMDEDVIFVNFNFRLGLFGFLSTDDGIVSGNAGLKDQVLALKWVQDNIASFGGNPNSVTLTGLSSGASSVHYHFLSGMSFNLFQRAFSQSGVALNSFALQEEPKAKAIQLAKAVGCPVASSSVLVKCLKQRPYTHLLKKMPIFYGYKFLPIAPFGPVLEKGEKPFINKNPYYLLAKGHLQDLPWLTSSVSHEGLFPAIFLKKDLERINQNWSELAPHLLDFRDSQSQQMWKYTSKQLKAKYFGEDEITEGNFEKLTQMFSDRLLADFEAAIRLQARANKSPVYYYNFAFPPDKAVAHGEDAQYFFYNMYNKQPTDNELKMKELLMEMLISFAKTGQARIGEKKIPKVEFSKLTFLNVTGFEMEEIKEETAQELAPRKFFQSLGFLENQNLLLIKDEL